MKILIVEDEFYVAMSLKLLLEVMGHEVVGVADDVTTAVDNLEPTLPQLAFIDIQLAHGASGLEAAAELRKRGVICIFLTGNPPERQRPDLALGCLSKPYTDKTLAGAISVAEAIIQGTPLPAAPPDLELYAT